MSTEDFLWEGLRCLGAAAGGAAFAFTRGTKSYREWISMASPGMLLGLFVGPLACDGLSQSIPWFKCDQPHVHVGVTFIVSLFGYFLTQSSLYAAEKILPDWLANFIRGMFGLPPIKDRTTNGGPPMRNPDSDAQRL